MRKILGIIGIIGMMAFAGCDKIEEGKYLNYIGPVIQWADGTTAPSSQQRAMVEKYTGPRCVNCPAADVVLASMHAVSGSKLVLVSVNGLGTMGEPMPGNPDMHTAEGNEYYTHFGVNNMPSAMLNRDGTLYNGAAAIATMAASVAATLTAPATIGIDVTAVAIERSLDITVAMQFNQEYTDPTTLTIAIVEDSLKYAQLSAGQGSIADYVHNHMLREVFTGTWGTDIKAAGTKGEIRTAKATFKVGNSNINFKNSRVVAFVSDKATKKVLNVAECEID